MGKGRRRKALHRSRLVPSPAMRIRNSRLCPKLRPGGAEQKAEGGGQCICHVMPRTNRRGSRSKTDRMSVSGVPPGGLPPGKQKRKGSRASLMTCTEVMHKFLLVSARSVFDLGCAQRSRLPHAMHTQKRTLDMN